MRQTLRLLVRALALLIAAGALSFALLAWQVDSLGRQDDAQAADAIVILGARVDADGTPGSDLTSRTYHAVDLYQMGYAPHLICCGGYANEPLSAAAVCRRFAVQLGVPADRVLLADGSRNTIQDAQAAARVMRARGWRKAILVSHPLHMLRARWLFRREGADAVTSPTNTNTGRIFLPLRAWYAFREAGAIVVTALDEWGWFPSDWMARLQTWSSELP